MEGEVDAFILKEIRGAFYNAVVLSVIKWLERNGGKYHPDEEPCKKAVWEHKKLMFKSDQLSHMFNKLSADLNESLEWQTQSGSNLHVIGFKCGQIYDTKKFEFRLGKYCAAFGVACVRT
jgi:hypothetical protein